MINSISNWRYIFLDTSVIIDLLQNPERFKKNENHRNRIIDTQKLFQYFKQSKKIEEKKYVFYVSSITIAELTVDLGEDLFTILLKVFNAGDLTFVDFTKEIAFSISENVREFVPGYSYHQLIRHIEKNIENDNAIINTRNWIEDDVKIASSAKLLSSLDVVLTADEKTFSPICENLKIPFVKTSQLPKDMFNEIDFNKRFN